MNESYRNSWRNYFSGISVGRGLRFLAATPNGVDWCVIRSRQSVKGVGRWRRAVNPVTKPLAICSKVCRLYLSAAQDRGRNGDTGVMENTAQNLRLD